MGVLSGCKPRSDVLKTDLDDTIFAADFGDLIAGKAPKVYKDAAVFFQNTHPAKPLCKVAESVFGRLATKNEPGVTIRLSTGFGGGKTHTLMALWHLAQNIDNIGLGTDVLPAAGRPQSVQVVAVDAGKAGVPEFSAYGKVKIKSLWGDIFYQLGGEAALKKLGTADDPEGSPSDSQIEAAFPKGPVLILLDELVIYMAKLSEQGQGNLLGFVNSLASVVSKRPQTVLVVTDPAGQAAYAQQAAQLGAALAAAATKLDEVFGRKMTDFDPIGDEAARVIVRRLFERVDATAAQSASATYLNLYQRVTQDAPNSLPTTAATATYAQRIVQSYPFHPRLLDTAQDRLGALQDFQKSRGVLRLFARILRDVWDSQTDCELISAGDINWSSDRIQADLLQRLNRDSFKAAVSADVEKHAGELDGETARGIHRRVASALLLESLPMQSNSGLDPAELTLAVLRPEEAGPEPAEALDRLAGVCWHTYPMPGGRGWQFRYEPNIIKQIEERKGKVSGEDAKSRVLSEAQGYFAGVIFKLRPWPEKPSDVPNSAELQLALCEAEAVAKRVCAYEDDTDAQAPIPRLFKNSLVAVTASPAALAEAIDRAQRLIAAEQIESENKSGEAGKLIRDQLTRVKPTFDKHFKQQARRAFDRVVTAQGMYPIEEKYQVGEEQIIQRAQGQKCIRDFLAEKKLIYKDDDALDAERFLKAVLPGATPQVSAPDIYSAKAVHERFLGAPELRLLPDPSVVRQTVLKALKEGKVVVRVGDRTYDSTGYLVTGADGRRQRVPGELTTFALNDDSVLIARADSDSAQAWVKIEDRPKEKVTDKDKDRRLPPPPPGRVTVSTWDKLVEAAKTRSVIELSLNATTPAGAATLMQLSQPLGADVLTLSVSVGGILKDGGTMNYAASDIKPNHATRPINIAQTIFNALAEGATYEAVLKLGFSPPRSGLAEALSALAEAASDGVSPQATLDKPMA